MGRDGSDRDASTLNGFLPAAAAAAAVRHLGERSDGVSGKGAAAMTTSSAATALQSPADGRMKVTSDKRSGFCFFTLSDLKANPPPVSQTDGQTD